MGLCHPAVKKTVLIFCVPNDQQEWLWMQAVDSEPSGVHHRPPPPAPTTALPSAVPSTAHGAESEVCLPLVSQSSEFVSAVVPGDAVVAVVHQSYLHVLLLLASCEQQLALCAITHALQM